MTSRSTFCIAGVAAVLMLTGMACRKSGQQPAESVQVETVCVACDKSDRVATAKPAHLETWPRQCSSCDRTSVYASGGHCINCRKLVPLKAANADEFGYPNRCPGCGKAWEN